MNLRWLFGNFTDPQYELSRAEQWKLTTEAHQKHLNQTELWGYTALFIISPTLLSIGWVIPATAEMFNASGDSIAYSLIILGFLVLFWIFAAWMYRFIYIKPLRQAMCDAGYVLCLECGYELRGLPDDAPCPECGATREVKPKDDAS